MSNSCAAAGWSRHEDGGQLQATTARFACRPATGGAHCTAQSYTSPSYAEAAPAAATIIAIARRRARTLFRYCWMSKAHRSPRTGSAGCRAGDIGRWASRRAVFAGIADGAQAAAARHVCRGRRWTII